MSDVDLSPEIVRSLTRNTREQVTCRRVAPNHYRCNWWAAQNTAEYDNPQMSGMLVTTSRICRSSFVRAVKTGDQLSITVISPNGSGEIVEPTS